MFRIFRKYLTQRDTDFIFMTVLLSFMFAAFFMWCFVLGVNVVYAEGVESPVTYICSTQKGTWVNVRETPSPKAREIGRLRYGYEIDVIETKDGYLHYKDEEGMDCYVRANFFERPDGRRYILTGNGRVVKRAKPNGKKLGYLNPGSYIDVIAWTVDEDGNPWARCYGNVYIKGRYLEVKE